MSGRVRAQRFGALSDGRTATLYTLTNGGGMTAQVTDYGGAVVRLLVPDREGRSSDVALGFESLASYEAAGGCLGAMVGRCANRIAGGRFELDGRTYDGLALNDGRNHLHGGRVGFSRRLWETVTAEADGEGARLVLTLLSPDGEEGYPGALRVRTTYALGNGNVLSIRCEAEADRPTPVSLTNHTYFNLAGPESGSVLRQTLRLDADTYLPVGADLIPTGEARPVRGTPFDFMAGKPIGRDIGAVRPVEARGYDHCLNFTGYRGTRAGGATRLRGEVRDPVSGRVMELLTNLPCVHLYTANFLDDARFPLRGGQPQRPRIGLCLETGMMPDSVHHQGDPAFTDVVLRPPDRYDYTTAFRFRTG